MNRRPPRSTPFPYTPLSRPPAAAPSPPPAAAPEPPPPAPVVAAEPPAAPPALTDALPPAAPVRSEEHTSELQSRLHLVCRLLLEKKKSPTLHIPKHARTSTG